LAVVVEADYRRKELVSGVVEIMMRIKIKKKRKRNPKTAEAYYTGFEPVVNARNANKQTTDQMHPSNETQLQRISRYVHRRRMHEKRINKEN
jgi:hypothetical protein